jgi:hypothetical protein
MAAVAALLVPAACSSNDDDTAETSVVRPAPSATDAPTTVPPATTAPTTAAPTTTLDPAEELAAQVEADFREADRLGREASMDPFDTAKEAAALERRLGVIRENFAAKLADWRERNYALRANPDLPASIEVEVPATLVLEGGDVAEMQICEVDSWVLVEVGAGPNGGDAVVNTETLSYRTMIFLRNVDEVWRVEGGNEIERWEGTPECPSE